MIISLTASADTYITNKIIDGEESTKSNVGKAGTLDLFTLFNESSQINSKELSRILIKFDLESLFYLTSSILNLNNMVAKLKLNTISTGNPTPNNFTISIFPLAQKFEEGMGRDIVSYADADISNYLTSSDGSTWVLSGCAQGGVSGSGNFDYITHADFGSGLISLEAKQSFETGLEELDVDITNIVSASFVNKLENNGFRISYSGSDEQSNVSLFVKRFASRHVKNKLLQPKLEIRFDDSKIDQRNSLTFDSTGSIYLFSKNNQGFTNLIDENANELVGNDCLLVTLSTGSFSTSFTGSQFSISDYLRGEYKTQIFISSNDASIVSGTTTLSDHIFASGSVSFDEKWTTLSGLKTFKRSTLKIDSSNYTNEIFERYRIVTRCDGPSEVDKNETFFLRCLFYDISYEETAHKFSFTRQPEKLSNVLYRIRDVQTDSLIFDFDEKFTKLSLDEIGNYVKISASSLPENRQLKIEFLINLYGNKITVFDSNYLIKVKV